MGSKNLCLMLNFDDMMVWLGGLDKYQFRLSSFFLYNSLPYKDSPTSGQEICQFSSNSLQI
ncbi:hypothetical protein ACN38_g7577, partial [Penicillium nordicum]